MTAATTPVRFPFLLLIFFLGHVSAFTVPVDSVRRFDYGNNMRKIHCRDRRQSVELGMGMLDDMQNFFSDFGGEKKDDNETQDVESENRLVTIPVRAIKPGGLRLFLMFYLMGMQNTPDPNAWKADQPTREEYVIDYYFYDRTAMLTIELSDDEITIDRIGSVPSNAYVMQETVIVEGILDELHQCAFDESIEEENRLLQLSEPKDAIDQARAALAFG